MLLDRRAHRVLARQHGHDIVARDELEIVDHRHRRWIGNGDGKLSAVALERQHRVLGRQLRRYQLEQTRIQLEARKIDGRHTVLAGEHAHDLRFRHHPQLDDGHPNALARRASLLLQRLRQLVTRQEPLSDEEITEPFGGSTGERRNRSNHEYKFRLSHVRGARTRRGTSLTLKWTVPSGKRHQRGEHPCGRRPDATHVTEAFHRLERSVCRAPRDDTGSECRSDARQPLQFRRRRGVHIDRQDRTRHRSR